MFCWVAGIDIHDDGASFVLTSLKNMSKMEMTFRVLLENLTIIQLLETCNLEIHHCVNKNMSLDAALN